MTQNRKPSADHARHDRLLVVRYLDLDNDLLASEVSQARALLASCPDCAALATELQLISDATSRMALPARPRDFRLTPQQAASLRPSAFRRFLENAGSAFRFEFLRPLAGVAVAIGLLLAVVGALPLTHAAGTAGLAAATDSGNQRVTTPQGPTAAPAAAPAPSGETSAATNALISDAGVSPMPVVAPASSAMGPMSAPTAKAAASPHASAAETQTVPVSAATTGPKPYDPATGTTTAVGPTGTPEAAQPPALGNSGAAVAAGSDRASDAISPLLILGVLLASLGLVVILLSFVARRIGRSAG